MGKDYQGYKDILEYFKYIKSQVPKGISLFKRGNKLYFLFKTQYKKRSDNTTGENFTTLGLYKNAKRQPIPFEIALKLLDDLPIDHKKEDLIKLICQIYQLQYPN